MTQNDAALLALAQILADGGGTIKDLSAKTGATVHTVRNRLISLEGRGLKVHRTQGAGGKRGRVPVHFAARSE